MVKKKFWDYVWLGKTESPSFWVGVLTDSKAREVKDILVTKTNNLNGFTAATELTP